MLYAHTRLSREDTANLSKPFVILSHFKPRRCWEGGRCKACKTLQYIELTRTKVKLLVAHPPAISEVRPKLLTIIFQAMKLWHMAIVTFVLSQRDSNTEIPLIGGKLCKIWNSSPLPLKWLKNWNEVIYGRLVSFLLNKIFASRTFQIFNHLERLTASLEYVWKSYLSETYHNACSSFLW